ncbi:hypothetical protein [Ferrovum myxofaciens]|uniref:hypothetical protein n=1 Tax=Ferrovum myxofaciens TaxID=416213 RepID=UPI002356DAA7|nr:hypothetical protein [Ferrovum myxofaciens]MBU6994042.1 hypothetical protein [Ferrovum myxofaciens]
MRDPIAKLYEKMTPDELATLALKAVCANDLEEGRRIAGFVPRVPYTGNDLAYARKTEGFFGMAEFFAKTFWFVRFKREESFSQALAFALHPEADTEGEALSFVLQNLFKYESWLMALDGALDTVCLGANLDPDGVRRLESIERFAPMDRMEGDPLPQPDPEMVGWITQQLTSPLDGKPE